MGQQLCAWLKMAYWKLPAGEANSALKLLQGLPATRQMVMPSMLAMPCRFRLVSLNLPAGLRGNGHQAWNTTGKERGDEGGEGEGGAFHMKHDGSQGTASTQPGLSLGGCELSTQDGK